MSSQAYQEALDYLYGFIDRGLDRSERYSAEVYELAPVRALLAALGDPQRAYPSVHIAGTKGKGSVSSMIASVLQAAGFRTGLFTSPHLEHFTERIVVDGVEISEAEVVALMDELKPRVEEISGLTVHRLITAMGFLYFQQREVDIAVIEVGLGGRLDDTNVIEPKVSIITSLSYDHMHLLGESLSDIAREKAGIIKSGVPVVSAPQQYEADRVVETIAHERGAPLVRVGRDWLFTPLRHDLSGQTLSIWSAAEQPLMDVFVESAGEEEWAPPRYRIPLLGYHQVINAAVAYAALQELKMQGVKVSEEAIQQGFQQVSWPGRFQILSQDPMLVVDSAHNRDSALKLRIALDEYFPGRPVRVIFGASTDKDIRGMLAELSPRVSRFIATQAVHPRALEAEQLGALARGYGLPTQIVVPVEKALLQALHDLGPEGVVLATGSLFVVGEVLSAWREQSEDLQPGIGEGVR